MRFRIWGLWVRLCSVCAACHWELQFAYRVFRASEFVGDDLSAEGFGFVVSGFGLRFMAGLGFGVCDLGFVIVGLVIPGRCGA